MVIMTNNFPQHVPSDITYTGNIESATQLELGAAMLLRLCSNRGVDLYITMSTLHGISINI
jgi:hypothetical protein